MASRLFTPRRRTDCLSVMAVRNRADEPPSLLYCGSPLVLSLPVTGARSSTRSPLGILERDPESFAIRRCQCRVKHHAGNGGVLGSGLTLTGALLRAPLNGFINKRDFPSTNGLSICPGCFLSTSAS